MLRASNVRCIALARGLCSGYEAACSEGALDLNEQWRLSGFWTLFHVVSPIVPAGFWAMVGFYYAVGIESGSENPPLLQATSVVAAIWCGFECAWVLVNRYRTLARRQFAVGASLQDRSLTLHCMGAAPAVIERDGCVVLYRTTGELEMNDGRRIPLAPNENPDMVRYDEAPLLWLESWWPEVLDHIETGFVVYLRKYPAGIMCPLLFVLLPVDVIIGRAPETLTMGHLFLVTVWVTGFVALRWVYLRSSRYLQPLRLPRPAE